MKKPVLALLALYAIVIGSGCTKSSDSSAPFPKGGNEKTNTDNVTCRTYGGGETDFGIFGGQQVHPQSWLGKSLVSIITTNDSNDSAICTGTVIAQNIILTAAHCVDFLERADHTFLLFTVDPLCEAQKSSEKFDRSLVRRVSKVKIHPDYISSNKKNGDLAILQIDGTVPYSYQPVKLASSEIRLNEFTKILLSGFGTEYDYNDHNDQAAHDLKFTNVVPYTHGNALKTNRQMSTSDLLYFDQRAGSGACAGDSGGPAFTRNALGAFRQIGVASKVDNLDTDATRQEEVTCKNGIVHVSVLFYKNWITETFQSFRTYESQVSNPFEN